MDDFAAWLFRIAERNGPTVGAVTSFFPELSKRGREGILTGFDQPLRDAPRTIVLSLPERTAGMGKQHLNVAAAAPE